MIGYTFRGSNYCFTSPLGRGQFLNSCRSKFFPLSLDPISKSYLIQRNKQEFMQVNIKLFSEKRQGVFIRAGAFIKINTVFADLSRKMIHLLKE